MAGLGVEVEEEGVAFVVHADGVALVGGAEVVGAGIDDEVDVGICVRGSDPVAVEAKVDLRRGEQCFVVHGFYDVDEGFTGRRLVGD